MSSPIESFRAPPQASVLVVDDELDLLDLARMLLEPAGYDVDIAEDGRQGLAAARRKRYDLIVLDITMPHMDGIELGHALRDDPANRNAVIVVHSALNEGWVQGFFPDYDAFLPKPAGPGELVAVVGRLLKEKMAQAPAGARATNR